ncbi:CBS domain-containing protein [archaeon]|jgi:CBS domain-containing protein|nr:CBS domain-containing protein [archaeon]
MIVSEVMNRVATINSNITLQHAARLMSREGIGSLVLMDKGKARGIITERDIVKNVSSLNKKVSTVMSKKLVTADQWAELEEIADIMGNNKIKRILIRDRNKKIVGIVTATDMIANADLLNQDLSF